MMTPSRHTLCLFLAVSAMLCAAEPQTLSNNLLTLQVQPVGGRISAVFRNGDKNDNLTADEGLLGDNFHHVSQAKFFLTGLPYELEKNGDSIRATAHHTGGGIDFLKLEKTISLLPDESIIHVKYTFNNLPAAMAANEYGFWSQNFINPQGNVNFFFPEMSGITRSPAKQAGVQFAYYRRPSRSWCGVARETGGGLAMAMDYQLLQQFYGWYGSKELTQEFYFDNVRIPKGESFSTDIEFIVFHTLKRLSGAGGGLVGDLSLNAEAGNTSSQSISLALFSGKKQKVRLVFTRRRLREGKPIAIHERTVDFKEPSTIQNIVFSHNFTEFPALFDIECRAFDESGRLLAIFNAPLGIGTGTISYRMKPQEERKGKDNLEINLQKFDNSRATPHLEWAKPLAGGKIRMMALAPYSAYREIAELAQRIDVDISSTLFLTQGRPQNSTGDYFGLLTEADISNNINDLLTKEYDVILLAGVNYDKLTEPQRQEIVKKVENGCGLILVGCGGKAKEIDALSPLHLGNEHNYPRAVPKNAKDGFLSTVPWQLIPATTCFPCDVNGDVIATVGKHPYVAMREHGKGRVFAVSYISSGGSGRMVSGLTPQLDYPLQGALFRKYYETYQLLFAKMIAAAARRDNSCTIKNAQIGYRNATYIVNLTFDKPAENLTLTLVTYNRDAEKMTRREYKIQPTNEPQEFKLPAQAWNGQTLIGMIVRNEKGEVLDFGATNSTRLPMARIHSLKSDKTHYQEGETATFTIAAAVEQRPAEVKWTLADAFGRVVDSGSVNAENALLFNVPIRSSLASRFYVFTVEMLLNGAVVDRHSVKFTATPEASKLVWDDFETGIWITPNSYDSLRPWLQGFFSDSLRKMRFKNIMGNSRDVDQAFAMNNNFNPTFYQSSGMRPSKVPDAFTKTGDKMQLVRTPCLSSPEFREKMRAQFEEIGKKNRQFGNRFYWFGDELSLTGYWSSAIDFCFSKDCLKGFQTFLKQKYGSVKKANEQWGTNFAKFDDFIPEIYQEAKKHNDGNYSAWADHLEFMDNLLCDYIRVFCDDGLRKGDAAAIGSISGPQAPSAYGGNNWEIQSKAHKALMSYDNGGLDEIITSFNPSLINLPWVLGYAHYEGAVCYNLWEALQYRANGAMAFSMASIVRPDGTLSRSGQAIADYMPEIAEGIGKLVLNPLKKRPAPEILIVYSQPSIRAAYIRGGAKRHENMRLKYIDLCRNYGIPCRFVSESEIENGKIAGRLLILPDIAAIGDKALSQCAAFAKKGGRILIDGAFAELDASCKTLQSRALAEEVRKNAIIASGDDNYDAFFKKKIAMRTTEESAALAKERSAFADVLKQGGIVPLARLVRDDGTLFLDAKMEIFSDPQKNKYVMAITKESSGTPLRIEFSQKGVVRNIRQTDMTLKNSNPFFFALLPEEETQQPTATVSVKGEIKIDCHVKRDTVVRATVRNPDGDIVDCYCANLLAPSGKATFRHTFALNDKSGEWTFEFREIVGGKNITLKLIRN